MAKHLGAVNLRWQAFIEPQPVYFVGTAAHLRQSPRMTLMFCAFTGARQVYVLDVNLMQTSCGMAVPPLDFRAERGELNTWAMAKSPDALHAYQCGENLLSIDGFPTGLPEALSVD